MAAGVAAAAEEAEEAEAAADATAVAEGGASEEAAALRGLFRGCVFFCGRECPVASLELLVLAGGGRIGWEGEASAFGADDARVTHVVVDRPAVAAPLPSREYVQPQWVYDCLNARALLPVHGYAPGKHCPPHLSPFRDGGEGYVPAERVRAALQEARAAEEGGSGGADDDEAYGDEDDEEDEDDGEDDDEDDDEDEEDEEDEEALDAKRYAAEVAAEVEGVSYNPNEKKRKGGAAGGGGGGGGAAAVANEEKELAKMMMSRKKRRLYDRMQYGIERKAAAADVLREKRAAIDAAAKGAKKKAKPKGGS